MSCVVVEGKDVDGTAVGSGANGLNVGAIVVGYDVGVSVGFGVGFCVGSLVVCLFITASISYNNCTIFG